MMKIDVLAMVNIIIGKLFIPIIIGNYNDTKHEMSKVWVQMGPKS